VSYGIAFGLIVAGFAAVFVIMWRFRE